MKKLILLAALVLVSIALLGQEQEQLPIQPQEEPQVQAAEPPPLPVAPQGRDLKKIRFPAAFIHAGKDYPAGNYWLVLASKDGQPVFAVQNDQKELLFEDLAIVKAHPAAGSKSRFHVDINGMKDSEYFRVKVTTQGEWFLGYFLVKK